MRTLLTILFFADTFLLAGLSYLLLRAIDNTPNGWLLLALSLSIAACIGLMAYFLRLYIRQRTGKH